MPQLLAQQTRSAAALHTTRIGAKSTKSGPLYAGDPIQQITADPGSETNSLKSRVESSRNVIDGVVGDKANSVKEGRAWADDNINKEYEARNQGSEASASTPLSQTGKKKVNVITTSEVEAREELHSHTKDITANEWESDEDEGENPDLDRKPGQNAAERLFPMSDSGIWRGPSGTKTVEVAELADDWQGAPGGASGSNSDSTGSTFDLGSSDDIFYGPIFNSQALQAYILLCCQVKY